MTVFTEGRHAAEFILDEANGQRSRDNVTVHGGFTGATTLKAGTVLGKITSGGKYAASPVSAGDGSQTAIAVLIDNIDISAGDVVAAVISRDAEVNGNCLEYEATVDQDSEKTAKATQLAAVGIIVR
jgi:hypothetical protein